MSAADPWFDWLTQRRQGGAKPAESISREWSGTATVCSTARGWPRA